MGSVLLVSMRCRVLPPPVLPAGLRSKFVMKIGLKMVTHLHSTCGHALVPLVFTIVE